MTVIMGFTMRLFYYMILALYISCYCSRFTYAGSSVLYVLSTDYLSNNVSCPQNDCHTLNEWIENDFNLELITNEIDTIVLLPGVHIINTTRANLSIEDIGSIVITSDGKASVWCISRFLFDFLNVEQIEISNIVFKSCGSLLFSSDSDIVVRNVIIEQGEDGISIISEETESETCGIFNNTILLHNLNITSKGIGIKLYCDCYVLDDACTDSTLLYLKNCTLNRANILIDANKCTQVDAQQITIKQISHPTLYYGCAFFIEYALKVSLEDITIEECTTHASLMEISECYMLELKGHIIFRYNMNSRHIAMFVYPVHSWIMKILPYSRIEFYNNRGIHKSLLQINSENDGRFYIEGHQYTNTSLQFKNNEILCGGSLMIIDITSDSPILFANYTEFIFENNTIIPHNPGDIRLLYYDINAVLLLFDSVVVFANTNMLFVNNSVPAGGIFAMVNSELLVYGEFHAKFENNEGNDGGAMTFYIGSRIEQSEGSAHFIFSNNRAQNRGGAIFVEDVEYSIGRFRHYISLFLAGNNSLVLDFFNNTAKLSGNEVYGGWINSIYKAEFNIINDNHYAVTSNPLRVCMCTHSSPKCVSQKNISIFYGQTFRIEAVAVGQRYGIVPATVYAQLLDSDGYLKQGQEVQGVGRGCTNLYYTVYSNQKVERIQLTVADYFTSTLFKAAFADNIQGQDYDLFQNFFIKINLKDCLLGFVFDAEIHVRVCSPKINAHSGVFCDLDNYQIMKSKELWLSAPKEHTIVDNRVIIHDFCPYDYCKQQSETNNNERLISFHLESPDDQCAFNRSGVLCGACQQNLSQIFGSSRCKKCSNSMIFVLVPGILFAGAILVGFIIFLNLTVSIGTINGLIFYANIIRVNQCIFLPLESRASVFLGTFIAWMNLDLGIETCFYNGLDVYVTTWLQFMFPLYIWLIVVFIIVSSHYSTTVSRLMGNNSVSVLATLFLLSYTKILRLVIIVFSSTSLEYPDGFKKRVWLYDGNLEFLKGKHAVLFTVSLLILLVLSIPYTLSLVSIQWLQRLSHFRLLSWVHQLMPLFDAYTGPYKYKHRYWTGLLLLVRVLFLVIFTQSTTNNPVTNLLTISVMSFIIFGFFCYMQVYKSLLNTVLETISLLNIGLLSVASSYQLLNNQNSMLTTSILVSIAFITFTFIVLYHASVKLASLKMMRVRIVTAIAKMKKDRRLEGIEEQQPQDQAIANIVTHSSIELKEPLIDQVN